MYRLTLFVVSVDTSFSPHVLALKYLFLSRGSLFTRPYASVAQENSTLLPAAFPNVILDEEGTCQHPMSGV